MKINHFFKHYYLYQTLYIMNKILLLVLVIFGQFCFAQNKSFQLSTHILNISLGQPAPDVEVVLQKMENEANWKTINKTKTDSNGRVTNFLPLSDQNNYGIYKLIFKTSPYFETLNLESFYPFIEVVFQISDNKHCHVPITLSPYGYSTYRGN